MSRIANALCAIAALSALLGASATRAGPLAAEPLPFDRAPVSLTDTPVLDRVQPGYQPIGLREGDFLIYPQVTLSEAYDDNLFATSNGAVGDLRTILAPQIDIRSDWRSSLLQFDVKGDIERYFDHPNEAVNDGEARLSGRLDAPDYFTFSGYADFAHATEPRSSTLSPRDIVQPIQYDVGHVEGGISKPFDRWKVSVVTDLVDTSYDNGRTPSGATVLENIYNAQEAFVDASVSYVISPDTALVAHVVGNDRHFTDRLAQPAPSSPLNRDSSGYETTAGLNFALTHLIRAVLLIGYLDQSYTDQRAFRPVEGPSAHVRLLFLPTGLTTLTLNFDRKINDAQDPVASSFLSTIGHAQVDHELYRYITVSGSVDYEQDQYKGIDRRDNITDGKIFATYLMDRHFSIKAIFDRLNVSSSGVARLSGYGVDQFSLALVSRF